MNDLITPRTLDTLEHKIFDEDVPQTDAIPTFLDACLWTTRMVTI